MCKSLWQKTLVVLLVVLCLTTLFACNQALPTHGLEIVEDEGQVAYLTQQEIDRLSTAVYGVMDRVVSSFLSFSTQAIEDLLEKTSKYVAQEVALLSPSKREYAALMSVLQRYTETETFSREMLVDNLYIDLLSALGKDKCAILFYHILLNYCDYQIHNYQQSYDQYGYASYREDAQRYRQKYQVLSTKLSPSDLIAGLNTYYIVSTVFSMVGQSGTDGFLSADEILMLLKAQNCTALALETDVWYELLTLAQDFVRGNHYGKVVDAAISNGDVRLLAEGMNDLVALVRHVQMTISAQDIQDIQQGKPVINVLLALFTDEQLRQIDAFLSKEWHYAEYDDLALKRYGDDYQQFAQQTEVFTVDQLLEARQNAPDAAPLLTGYLAGKSYALAWEVQP